MYAEEEALLVREIRRCLMVSLMVRLMFDFYYKQLLEY